MWAAKGDRQWIIYDTGSFATMQEVAIAWVRGNQRKTSFAIEVSIDGKSWSEVHSGDSSGQTNEFEFYAFSPTSARYVRIVGYGNSSNRWNKIAEVELYGQSNTVSLPIASVRASEAQGTHVPANTIDGKMATHWHAKGDGQWIAYDVGLVSTVNKVSVAWVRGNQRKTFFTLETSVDGNSWNEVFSGESSGSTNDFESYTFSPTSARYVRIVGHGNSSNRWNKIAETEVHGHLDIVPLPINSVRASDAEQPNVAANTVDGDLKTRWAAKGKRQWIRYDIGASATISEVAVAWTRGNQRKTFFSIEVATDGKSWREVYRGESSGKSNDFESYTFSPISSRYVRIVGYGNSSNKWNKINEVELYGLID